MDEIRSEVAAMQDVEVRLRSLRLAEMENAYRTTIVTGILAALLGLALTVLVAFVMHRAAQARARHDWFQRGREGLTAAMLGEQRTEELSDSILRFLGRFLDAQAGVVYIREGDLARRTGTYGVPTPSVLPEYLRPEQGLIGQAFAQNRAIVVKDVPDVYLRIGSALGESRPKHLVITPSSLDGTVNAVIEFGFFRDIEPDALELLAQVKDAIGLAVRSANYRAELQALLEETQRQSEELQAQSEELRVSNEELEEQGRALKESQFRLEQQQAELEQTNSQLEEQARQLEIQRDDLALANDAVELKARELEQASRYKSDFLANMSHELRTPLNSLLILAKLLADNPDENLSDEQVRYARTIQSSGNDLLTLINDILDLSKIEAGHMEIRPEPFDLSRLTGDLEILFSPVATRKGLSFKVSVAPDVSSRLETDRQRLEQIVRNLLSNAMKFTEVGSVELAIQSAGEGRLAFAVKDTGVGIAPEHQSAIFDAFRQADGTISRRFGGTGLGLSISRELARLLGGAITLESAQGRGSTFTLTIPAVYAPGNVAARVVEPTPIAPAAPPVRLEAPAAPRLETQDDRDRLADNRRVLLVVEDDETFARILQDLSREMNFQSLVAATADEALTLARRYLPHAIVLDVGLPDQSGLSVLDQLKHDVRTRHIPVHIISGADHSSVALSLGAVGYMMKPVRREDVVDVLRKLETKLDQRIHRVLIVEDDAVQRDALSALLGSQEVETVAVGSAAECLERLRAQTYDCMVLDLSLPDASGYTLLETLSREPDYSFPPVIVYTGRDLTAAQEQQLRRYSKSIIIKGAKSPERLLDEVTLFLHQVVSELPPQQQKMLKKARNRDALLEGRRILVVEDDVRNIYSLTNVFEPRGAIVEIARNGREALDALEEVAAGTREPIDLVLMDVMMPVMDGLTATREIRQQSKWSRLPIIMLTAKAMQDDQEKCIAAGANDYMAKPLDVEKLLSLVRVWMPR